MCIRDSLSPDEIGLAGSFHVVIDCRATDHMNLELGIARGLFTDLRNERLDILFCPGIAEQRVGSTAVGADHIWEAAIIICDAAGNPGRRGDTIDRLPVSYTHLRAHE